MRDVWYSFICWSLDDPSSFVFGDGARSKFVPFELTKLQKRRVASCTSTLSSLQKEPARNS